MASKAATREVLEIRINNKMANGGFQNRVCVCVCAEKKNARVLGAYVIFDY